MSKKDKSAKQPRFQTAAIHGGLDYRGEAGPVTPPIYATSTFETGNKAGFDYTRSGNPNFYNLESTLRKLEKAEYATTFASGVSAITAVASNLSAGDIVLAEENIYGCTYRLFEQVLSRYAIKTKYVDFSKPEALELIEKHSPSLVWIESPTNPLLKIVDIAKIAEACNSVSSSLLVDNTFASSWLQSPLELGAHLSLSSTTKYINGHSDCLGGVVCTNSSEWRDKLVFAQKALGLNPSPFDAWLISRGVKTFALRMEQHCSNSLKIAEHLVDALGAEAVRYPFLPSHPQYELAKRQMSGGSGLITCDLGLSAQATREALLSLRYFSLAESLGGVESLICHPATMTHASVPEEVRQRVGITDSLVRLSVGIEHVDDLIEDIQAALLSRKTKANLRAI